MKPVLKSLYGKISSVMGLVVLLAILTAGCAPATPVIAPASEATSTQVNSTEPNYTGKKILYINSYNKGYAWSDDIESALHEGLDNTGVELKIIDLDTKRNPAEAFAIEACLKAKAELEAFKPDVLIVSEDNVQKYLVVPYLKETNLPVVFVGINWDASAYGYPTSNITGMLEVELQGQLTDILKQYAKGSRVGYVTIDTETERKGVDIINNRFFNGEMKIYWAKTQEEFKTAFIAAQQEVDILFLGNNAGSSDKWDEAGMKQFILNNTTIPTGAVRDWMAPYVLVTLAKSGTEQGEWAAQTALRILDGTPVSEIPVVENRKGNLILNLGIADKLGVVFAPSLLKNATVLDE